MVVGLHLGVSSNIVLVSRIVIIYLQVCKLILPCIILYIIIIVYT